MGGFLGLQSKRDTLACDPRILCSSRRTRLLLPDITTVASDLTGVDGISDVLCYTDGTTEK